MSVGNWAMSASSSDTLSPPFALRLRPPYKYTRPPTRPATTVTKNHSTPSVIPIAGTTPYEASIQANPPSRTPTPLTLTGSSVSMATTGTATKYATNGKSRLIAWPISTTTKTLQS